MFPNELLAYGLDEKLLAEVFGQVQSQQEQTLVWHLRGIPDNEFYQDLHSFLKRWPRTCTLTKVSIGKFYIAVDMNLQYRGVHLIMLIDLLKGLLHQIILEIQFLDMAQKNFR